ncbi:hypothetical protein DL93DRAFT_2081354 [Clavulina sp. PMI_390]|nr:hypothetical protein DL93DRAFT_2081354 [Clavulina sp. PMI_390]
MSDDWEMILVEPRSQGSEELWRQCLDVRMKVFAEEQGFPVDTEIDDYDIKALHFLLRTKSTPEAPSPIPFGVIRFNPSTPSQGKLKLARLAVLPAYRRKGHAERLVEKVHEWAREELRSRSGVEEGKTTVWLHAQIPVIRFYER